MSPHREQPSGLLVLDKPAGISSAQALNRLKRRLPRGTKLGHAGTLDPFATGVLVVLVGRATKLCERIMGLPKGYDAELYLGATTPSFDPETQAIPVPGAYPPRAERIEDVLTRFVGDLMQEPPAYSAIKVDGQRSYALARAGKTTELPPRLVRIDRLELLEFVWPKVTLRIECGRGFYVRSLARDIGQELGTGAYLTGLRRTFVGPFRVENAVSPDTPDLPLLPLNTHLS